MPLHTRTHALAQALSLVHKLCTLLWFRGCASALGHLIRLLLWRDSTSTPAIEPNSPRGDLPRSPSGNRLFMGQTYTPTPARDRIYHLLMSRLSRSLIRTPPTYIFWWAVALELKAHDCASAGWARLLFPCALLGLSQLLVWVPHALGTAHDPRWRGYLTYFELVRCLQPTAALLGSIGSRSSPPVRIPQLSSCLGRHIVCPRP